MKRSNLLHLSECRAKSKHLVGFYSPAGLIYTGVFCTRTGSLIYKFIKYIILPPLRHRERAEC